MTLWKRILAGILVVALAVGVLVVGIENNRLKLGNALKDNTLSSSKQTLRLWYTDEALTDYLSSAALSFYEETNVRVLPTLVSGMEYLENIYDASVNSNEYPDVYLISNDSLEKAYLAGAASYIKDTEEIVTSENYPTAAINAVTYKDHKIGYPFYYETSVFLYNETYMEEMATKLLEEEGSQISTPAIQEKAAQMLPKTIDDILTLADNYDAPENVEAVFKWDVSDIFYNYFFVGNSMNVGGAAGDNPEEIDIYNEGALKSLKVYQELNQFFSIDPAEVNYESVVQDFIDGKIVFSVVTTDAIAKIEAAKEERKFAYDYGITTIPNINNEIKSGSLSVTNAVVVNGYSKQKDIANAFAKYLSYDCVDTLYSRAGKIPSKKAVSHENENVTACLEEYEDSIPITKMVEASNFWIQLEICFTKVWTGEDVEQQLKLLSEQILTQITGKPDNEE